MTRCVYYLTTVGRAHAQVTLGALPRSVRQRTALVVQAAERRLYDHLDVPKLVLPPHITRLSPTREWLAQRTDQEKLFLLDDDLVFYMRKSLQDWHLVKPTEAQLEGMFGMLEEWLDVYAHVAVSPREGNNRVQAASAYCTRAMRCVGYQTRRYAALEPLGRLQAMSDFDATLQLLRQGHANRVTYQYAQNHASSNAPGGCSTYRTKTLLAVAAVGLANIHAPYVKLVTKETKGAWGGGERLDVQVQWKKAYNDGLSELLK